MSRDDDVQETTFGVCEIQGKDIATPSVKFDRIAITGSNQLLLLSVIAETHIVKQMRAILSGGAKATIQAAGIKVKRPGDSEWYAHSPGRLFPSPDGYACHQHKLGYGLAHAIFITRSPGFMPVVTPESLWNELSSARFTTPILKEWVGYIEETLRERELLEDAHVFNCRCGVLSAVTSHLDEVVSDGLKLRQILIPIPN